MRRRLLNKMLTDQEARNRSEATKALLVPVVNFSHLAQQTRNDGAVLQGASPSSPQGLVPPSPAAPKRGPGRPRKDAA